MRRRFWPQCGTIYSYQSYADGIQLDNSYDLITNLQFDSLGVTDSNGDHIFNLDKLNRAAILRLITQLNLLYRRINYGRFEDFVNTNLGIRRPIITDAGHPSSSSKVAGIVGKLS